MLENLTRNADSFKKHPEKHKKKFTKAGIWTLLTLLMAESGIAMAQEQGKNESPEDLKNKIMEMERQSAAAEKEIINNFVTLAKEGKIPGARVEKGEFQQTPARIFYLPTGEKIMVGYGESEMKNPLWVMYSATEDKWLFLDQGADGTVNRAVSRDPNNPESVDDAEKYAFMPMEDLAEEAETTANLVPENTTVYEFNGNVIRAVNFKNGSAMEGSGDKALGYQVVMTNYLNDRIEEFKRNMYILSRK